MKTIHSATDAFGTIPFQFRLSSPSHVRTFRATSLNLKTVKVETSNTLSQKKICCGAS